MPLPAEFYVPHTEENLRSPEVDTHPISYNPPFSHGFKMAESHRPFHPPWACAGTFCRPGSSEEQALGKASQGSWQQAGPSYINSSISESLPCVSPTPRLSGSSFPNGSFLPAGDTETHESEEGVDSLPQVTSVRGRRLGWGPVALQHSDAEFLWPRPLQP